MNEMIAKKELRVLPERQNPASVDFARFSLESSQIPTIMRRGSCACGGGCPACKSGSGLKVSQPGDPAEIEADRMADDVMRMPVDFVSRPRANPAVQSTGPDRINRKCDDCETGESSQEDVLRKEDISSETAFGAGDPPQNPVTGRALVDGVIGRGGAPLDISTRNFFEPRFGRKLGDVRIHSGSEAEASARAFAAKAYTVGTNVVFGRGEFNPQSHDGRRLLAHELAHVVQHDRPASPVIARERDPRLDDLMSFIEHITDQPEAHDLAAYLNTAIPDIDLDDLDNSETVEMVLDDAFGTGFGYETIAEWRLIQIGGVESQPTRPSAPAPRPAAPAPVPAAPHTDPVVSSINPGSMTGTALESEIALIRLELGVEPLDPESPETPDFTPMTDHDQLRLDRLFALETEYFQRRGPLEASRRLTSEIASQQRSTAPSLSTLSSLATAATTNPAMLPILVGQELLGNPVEDAMTGFIPGFLGGASLELPRDAYQRLDARVGEDRMMFQVGGLVGELQGVWEGLRDMVLGLIELAGLAIEYTFGSYITQLREAIDAIENPDEHQRRQMARLQSWLDTTEAVFELVTTMFNDHAFMIQHGRVLGEVAGREAAQWFNEDFMRRTQFEMGRAVGRILGRIVFEVAALFLGPEEWIVRGATAVGEAARATRLLRGPIMELLERLPALRRILVSGREGAIAGRELRAGERALSEGGELAGTGSRMSEGAGDVGRGAGRADESLSAVDDVPGESRAGRRSDVPEDAPGRAGSEPDARSLPEAAGLNRAELDAVGPINRETVELFQHHPERLTGWAENPAARRVCKLCQSPCFPRNVDQRQAAELERLVERARQDGIHISDHAFHDPMKDMTPEQIDNFIELFDEQLTTRQSLPTFLDDASEGTATGRSIGDIDNLEGAPGAESGFRTPETPAPQRLQTQIGSPESYRLAREAGLPDELLADGTVMTSADFPDVLPDSVAATGRVAPDRLAPITALDDQGRAVAMRPVSRSDIQNTEVVADFDHLVQAGADPASIRINQMQVVEDMRVGTNRPDLYAEINGRRVLIEYDRAPGTRAIEHARRILSNDPDAIVILKIVDFD
jgi:hypothetical protein